MLTQSHIWLSPLL